MRLAKGFMLAALLAVFVSGCVSLRAAPPEEVPPPEERVGQESNSPQASSASPNAQQASVALPVPVVGTRGHLRRLALR